MKLDRNAKGHLSENESDEFLYNQALMDLLELKRFVETVDEAETTIPKSTRDSFFTKWSNEIQAKKELIDNERIKYIQFTKEVERDVALILKSNDPLSEWIRLSGLYSDRYLRPSNDQDINMAYALAIKASDEGISYAHKHASDYYAQIGKEAEFVKRSSMDYETNPSFSTVWGIVGNINLWISLGHDISDRIKSLVNSLIEQGYEISMTESGFYHLERETIESAD